MGYLRMMEALFIRVLLTVFSASPRAARSLTSNDVEILCYVEKHRTLDTLLSSDSHAILTPY